MERICFESNTERNCNHQIRYTSGSRPKLQSKVIVTKARAARRHSWRGAASVLAAAALWGTIGPVQVAAPETQSPQVLAAWRLLIGGSALVLLAYSQLAALCHTGKAFWYVVAAAGALSAGYQVAFMSAVAMTGAAIGTVVGVATVPLFSGIFARITAGERITYTWVMGSSGAALGCGVLLLPTAGDRVGVAGVGCGVLAGALFSAYTVAAKQMAARTVDVKLTTGLSMLFGAVLLSPLIWRSTEQLVERKAVLAVAWLGLGATALAYAMYNHGLRRVSVNTAGTLSLAEPLAAALLSVLLLGEHMSALQWTSCAAILCGILLASMRGRGEPTAAPAMADRLLTPQGVVARSATVGSSRDLLAADPRSRAAGTSGPTARSRADPPGWSRTASRSRGPAIRVITDEAGLIEARGIRPLGRAADPVSNFY